MCGKATHESNSSEPVFISIKFRLFRYLHLDILGFLYEWDQISALYKLMPCKHVAHSENTCGCDYLFWSSLIERSASNCLSAISLLLSLMSKLFRTVMIPDGYVISCCGASWSGKWVQLRCHMKFIKKIINPLLWKILTLYRRYHICCIMEL